MFWPLPTAVRSSAVARSTALALGLALALPALGAPALLARCADSFGDQIAWALEGVLEPLRLAIAPAMLADIAIDDRAVPVDSLEVSARPPERAPHAPKYPQKPAVTRGIRISAEQVLRLAARRAMPGAVPVNEGYDHPAGLRLIGVSALGVGLQDGDVLTEAAGQRATSLAAVVGVVLAARDNHSPEISGRFFRHGVLYSITVEQPYLPADVKG